jgi:dolichol-phosphate mannosyltransferase
MTTSSSGTAPEAATWQVPEHDVLPLANRRSRHAVCLFVINEAERLHRQLARMRATSHGLDVVVADGGSTDGSTDPETLRCAGVRCLLVKRGPGRLGAQMRMGLAWCLGEGYDGIVIMDGNDKDDPEAIPRFSARLDAGDDHVQGSRYIPGGRAINTPLARHLAVTLLHAPAVSLAALHRYTDTTNGFRAYSRRLLEDPRVAPFRDVFTGYEMHYYLAIRAARLGLRVSEIPVTRAYPADGHVPTKIRGMRGNSLILLTLAKACLGLFDPR